MQTVDDVTFDFSGRTALITGAARGIGLELTRFFVAAGAKVFMADLDEAELTSAARGAGGHPIVSDVSNTESVEAAVETIVAESGRLDIVINNAGVLRDCVLWKLTDDDWQLVQDIHLGGTFRVTRAATPHFRRQSYGRVINVTSYTGLHGNVGQANYAAAKAGIIGFTKTAAKELARFGVTVNVISPSAETRMIASIPADRRRELEAMMVALAKAPVTPASCQ
jgi:3-oxoacyl-[acyl-carrier protein] reductase